MKFATFLLAFAGAAGGAFAGGPVKLTDEQMDSVTAGESWRVQAGPGVRYVRPIGDGDDDF